MDGTAGSHSFYEIVLFLLGKIARVARWIYLRRDAYRACLPITVILVEGLVNAFLRTAFSP